MVNRIADYLTIYQAAKFVGVTPNTLRNWEKCQKLRVYRNPQNQYRLYKQEDLEALLNTIRPNNL
jgi:MerR family copper efflux transcriptional regulator